MQSESEMLRPTADEVKRRVVRKGGTVGRWIPLALLLVLVIGGVAYWRMPREVVRYWVTEAAERGDITTSATATGTLEPRRQVTVGAEISGVLETVEVEDNEEVKAGQVLARFDTTDLEKQLELARSRVSSSDASIRGAKASFDETAAELRRTETLVERGVVARADLEALQASAIRSRAEFDRARSDRQQSSGTVEEMQLKLNKAVIVSPIDGVIMARNVEPGQTVASSLQAPELFVVAEDLSRMQLNVWVDEADIGVVQPGQAAKFEVSAWADRKFDAVVDKLDLSPTITDNVVTYTAQLSVDNSERLLRPGMTASVTIVTGVRENVLRVPNAALRFEPPAEEAEAGSPLMPMGRWGRRRSGGGAAAGPGATGTVWVLEGGVPAKRVVTLGRSDGRHTEIAGGELQEGEEVLLGEQTAEAAAGAGGKPGARR